LKNINPQFLQRLGIEAERWIKMTNIFEVMFKDLVGTPSKMDIAIELMERKRRPGITNCKALLT